jgi:tetratricopeptide (TPR) repeat protein
LDSSLLHISSFLAADASRGALSYGQALQHSFKAILAPPAPVIFHGRDDDVRRIVRTILGDDQSRVPILGTAGIGKTTIALAVINNSEIVQKFGDRRYFVPCDEVTKPLLLAELLATHLGIALKSVDPMQDILAALRTHASPCIVVLDNFETPWDPHATQSKVESILAGLSGVPNLSLIITMRGTSTPMGVKWSHIPLEVSPLSLDAARSTFRDNCPIEDEALDDLLIALDFVPLAVTLMAAVGKSSKLAPSDLLKSWQKEQTSLLDLGPSDRLKSVDYSIRLSLQGAAMTSKPEALQMLSVLAMLPRGASPESLLEMVPSIVRLDAAIRVLIKVSLVYKDTTGVLRLLSPIRSYISHHHPPDDHLLREVRAFYYRLAQSCSCGPGDEDFLSVREKVLPEETNIDAILSGSLLQTPDRDCVIAVINYSQFLIFNHPRTETLALATSVARRAPFPNLLGRCLQRFGEVLYAQSRFDEARVKMEEARQQFQKGGQRLNAAICLRSLGDILRRQSQLDLAWDTLQEARRQFDGVGDRLGSAFCLRSLSNIRRLQSRYDEARKMLSEARVQFQALGHGLGAARCLRSLGDILVMQNQFDEAATVLENGHSRFKAIGHELGAARCRQTLGEVLRKQRRFSEAQKVLEEVLEQFKEGGDRLGTARCLRGLGDIHRMECRYDQAFATLDEARQQFDEIGNRLGHAQCLWRLGVIFYMQQRYEAARIYTEDARKQFLQIGNRHGVAQSLQSLGDIFRMQGSLAESHTALEESLDHFQDIGDQIGISQCLQSLSIIDHSIS